MLQQTFTGVRLDPENPWPGLDSYDESSQKFFSGRGAEIDELLRRVHDEPVTVLFGKSGLGKTSLLKAGLFPGLREKDYLPIYIRLLVQPDAPPLIEQVRQALAEELRRLEIEHPPWRSDETLWEYLHRAGLEFWTRQNRLVPPVLVFDQFEELFTLGRAMPAEIQRFRNQLADLAENRIPEALATRLDTASASELKLDPHAMCYKMVVSLREDFLADLEGWRATMPSLRRSRMRLLPMGPSQAFSAVYNDRTRHLVSEPLARKIVAFLASDAASTSRAAGGSPAPTDAGLAADDTVALEVSAATVEPALLSLFCRGVNEHRKRDRKAVFDEALLEGAKETIVTDFYRDSLSGQPEMVRRFIEEELVTEHGFRNSYSVDDALAHGQITAQVLDLLVDRRLLRREHHLGADRVELTHDLLTKAVVEERDRRRRAEGLVREQKERRRLWWWRAVTGASVLAAVVFIGVAIQAWEATKDAKNARDDLKAANTGLESALDAAKIAKAKAQEKAKEAADASIEAQNRTKEAVKERNRADTEAKNARAERSRAESRELAARAQNTIDQDPELATLLALEGVRRTDTGEARSALLKSAQFTWPNASLGRDQLRDKPSEIALSPDGTRLAVVNESGQITLWDLTTRHPKKLREYNAPGGKSETRIGFSPEGPDGSLLAVRQGDVIKIFDVNSGQLRGTPLNHPGSKGPIAFSPDGQWLATTATMTSKQGEKTGEIWLWPHRTPQPQPIRVPVAIAEIHELAFDHEMRILMVIGHDAESQLAMQKLEQLRDNDWKPASVSLTECVDKPQSASAGSTYYSTTFLAMSCTDRLTTEKRGSLKRESNDDRTIEDVVWSKSGNGYVQILKTPEFVVRTWSSSYEEPESRVKGVNFYPGEHGSLQISVSADGKRLAVVERGAEVSVYWLAERKVFLAPIRKESLAISPGGDWLAIHRSAEPPANAKAAGQSWIDVIAVDDYLRSPGDFRIRRTISFPGVRLAMFASQQALIVTLPTDKGNKISVYDAGTGNLRYETNGEAQQLLGRRGELLLVKESRTKRVIAVADGKAVLELTAGNDLGVSPVGEAVAILKPAKADPKRVDAAVYKVDGVRLVPVGSVGGLNPGVSPSDDGKYVLERARRAGRTVDDWFLWRVSPSAQKGVSEQPVWSSMLRPGRLTRVSRVRMLPDGTLVLNDNEVQALKPGTRAVAASDEKILEVSPLGGYVLKRIESSAGTGEGVGVVRRDTGVVVTRFRFDSTPQHAFSADDHWLAVWSDNGVVILDLAQGKPAVNLDLAVSKVKFEAGGRIARLIGLKHGGEMLVPLDRSLMERFAMWLAGREMTKDERCAYVPDTKGCDQVSNPAGVTTKRPRQELKASLK